MRRLTYVVAILAAASTAAMAKDLNQDKKGATPAVSAAQMTESEMDNVTAGASFTTGHGIGTAIDNGHGRPRPDFVGGAPGSGRCIHFGGC